MIQAWLAGFAALLVEKLLPWIYQGVAGLVSQAAAYLIKKYNDIKAATQRKQDSKQVDKDIQEQVPREQRQKDEEKELNG